MGLDGLNCIGFFFGSTGGYLTHIQSCPYKGLRKIAKGPDACLCFLPGHVLFHCLPPPMAGFYLWDNYSKAKLSLKIGVGLMGIQITDVHYKRQQRLSTGFVLHQ